MVAMIFNHAYKSIASRITIIIDNNVCIRYTDIRTNHSNNFLEQYASCQVVIKLKVIYMKIVCTESKRHFIHIVWSTMKHLDTCDRLINEAEEN